ncbi:DUF3606 domain-containing protein [Bradyrhizobium sp. OAE829]|uniref:DUF3606 domain-containing protein n=1 Tax=Bradyrhizobium sp. OAE829 TaxID=2663807 RepID=UPI00178BF1EE
MSRPVPYTDVIIDPMNGPQVEHWAKDLQVQTYELRAAIKLIGPRLSHLRRYYGRSADIIVLSDRRAQSRQTAATWSAFSPV